MINCKNVLPITFRMPISFSLLLERATVVFEKLRQAERNIKKASTNGPYAAESSGRSYRLFESMYSLFADCSLSDIRLKLDAFQSSLALFCTGRYFFNFSAMADASD